MTQQITAQLLKGGLTVDASGNVTAIGRFSGPTQRTGTIKAQDGTTAITIANSTGVITITSPVINTGISGTAILDEDAMGSNSDTKLATQKSIKAYVDGKTHLSLIDEDNMVTDSDTRPPSQQSVKAYVDASEILGISSTGSSSTDTVTIAGNLTVDGLTTIINSTTLSVDDRNIELGSIATPTDATADGGGIILKGASGSNKTILWTNSTDTWDFNQGITTSGIVTATGGTSSNWNTAYGWGDHSGAGYLTSQTSHTDVVIDGDFTSQGIILRGASAGAYSILTNSSANWNTAYGWGDHSGAGYATSGGAITVSTINGTEIATFPSGVYNNLGIGVNALDSITTGGNNTALGDGALTATENGQQNLGMGRNTLTANVGGSYNIAIGDMALATNVSGTSNTAIGKSSLYTTTGSHNTAIGEASLFATTGSYNVGIGKEAGDNITTGSSNIIIGASIDAPSATASNQLNIGNTIYGDLSTGKVGIGTDAPDYPLHTKMAANGYAIVSESTDGGEKVGMYFGGSNDAGIGTITDTSLDIFTNGSTAMTIDSVGRITTPNQPAFVASITSYSSDRVGNWQKYTAFAEVLDRESNFNNSSGYHRFTAPIGGYYLMGVCIEFNASSVFDTTTWSYPISMKLNGTTYIIAVDQWFHTAGKYQVFSYTTIRNLSANDYIDWWSHDAGNKLVLSGDSSAANSWVWGYLIG